MSTLTPKGYLPRLVDDKIDFMMDTFGSICIEGPKWCGKTWTSLNKCRSQINVSRGSKSHGLVSLDSDYAFDGPEPRLIDEWQDIPELWDRTKIEVDKSRKTGRFILTGSSTPVEKGLGHSGAGRIASIRMRTMSLFESGDSDGSVSLNGIMCGTQENTPIREVSLSQLMYLTCRGGWPHLVGKSTEQSIASNIDYLDKIVGEASRIDGIGRDKEKMKMTVRSLARNECTTAKMTSLAEDIAVEEDSEVSVQSIRSYLDALDRMFILENQLPFGEKYRSSSRVGKSPKRHLTDPSLAVAALRLTPEKLIEDLNTFGFLFESMCERDLQIYASSTGGSLYHYREGNNGIDAVVEMPDGRWGAFEVKLGTNQIDRAASNLLKCAKLFPARPPSALCVVCGMAPCSYLRPDGVRVVPITSLRN